MFELRFVHAARSWVDPRTGRQWKGSHEPPAGREALFGAELWLQAVCCGGRLLWANNAAHLDYLADYVAGELREDLAGMTYKPLSSKLPKWMKEAKHRDEVLSHLARLRKTLEDW